MVSLFVAKSRRPSAALRVTRGAPPLAFNAGATLFWRLVVTGRFVLCRIRLVGLTGKVVAVLVVRLDRAPDRRHRPARVLGVRVLRDDHVVAPDLTFNVGRHGTSRT